VTRLLSAGAAIVLAAAAMPGAAQTVSAERAAVERAMDTSAAAWSAGDLDRFLDIYSDAPTTSFVTAEGVIRGKAAMRALYRRNYAFEDAAKRGALSFATQDFRMLGKDHALLIARYTLRYADGRTQSGLTSVVFAREGKGWRIVADHSS
jgi:uncharacterized protein (TIGR02246 family)